MKRESAILDDAKVYRQLFINASEGLVLCDAFGHILEVNPRCCNLFGYEASELLGKKIEILIPTGMRHAHEGHRDKYRQSPENRSMGIGMNLKGQRKDGTVFPVEVSLNHYRDGEELMIMALVTDITKRVKIEDQIRDLNEQLEQKVQKRTREVLRSQNLYVSIARNFPDGTISVFDENLNYLFFEGKELYQAGIETDMIIGTSIRDRLPDDVKDDVINHLKKVLTGEGGILEFETKGQVFEFNAVPIYDEKQKVHQILVVERNRTKQKRAEDEILNALSQERALNELKSRFVSMASHEFRTPLSTILSSISLISKYNNGENSEKVNKHIGRIKSSVQNLNGILNDFLSLDKLEEGKISTRTSEVHIMEHIADLIDELEAVLKKGQIINVRYDLERDLINVDPQILKNILINLTSNAIKYSPEEKEIKLNVKVSKDEMVLTVEDKGIGIPKEEQSHMFERFFRAKNVTNIGGTGLGLNIVKKYVELLEGEIKFASEEGKGTKFTVRLPI